MRKLIFLATIFGTLSLNALTYQETIRACEEALENQDPEIRLMKMIAERQRNERISEGLQQVRIQYKEQQVQRTIEENNRRLGIGL